jgi:hypothetical protein
MENTKAIFLSHELVQIWQDYAKSHSDLLELTIDEYHLLLNNQIEEIEKKIIEKEKIITDIKFFDDERKKIVSDICQLFPQLDPNLKFSALVDFMETNIDENAGITLGKLNSILLELIKQLQTQNKKNQIFLNKSLHTIAEIKKEFSGKKYSNYSSKGREYHGVK